jgi:LysM repeat protein
MLNKTKIWGILSVLVLLGLPVSLALANDAQARLTPQTQNIAVGQVTNVTFEVQNVDNLYGYQVGIAFDPTVLQVIDADTSKPGVQVQLGPFISPDFVQQNSADNSAGAIICVVSQLAPSSAVSGSGTLLTISFQGKFQGVSDVRFTDLKLARNDGFEISVVQQNAQVTVGSGATPTSTFTPTPTSTVTTPTPTSTTPTPTYVPPTATPTLEPGQTVIYVVRTGDTLYSIARQFNVTVQALTQINNISNSSYIQVGQQLIIPRGAPMPSTTPAPTVTPVPANPIVYIVQGGDTLYSIARRYGTTVQAIAMTNNIVNPSRIFVGQRLVIYGNPYIPPAPSLPTVHVVQLGETLYSIARRYGTSVWAIAMANNLYNPNVIYAGQRLAIP